MRHEPIGVYRGVDDRWRVMREADGRCFVAGPCVKHRQGHDTPHEAAKCLKSLFLDALRYRTVEVPSPCRECRAESWHVAYVPAANHFVPLCPDHLHREYVARHFDVNYERRY